MRGSAAYSNSSKTAVYGSDTISYKEYINKINKKNRARKNLIRLIALFVIFIIALVIIIILSTNAVKTKAAESVQGNKYYRSVMIRQGDSLWSIANEYMDSSEYIDTKEYIKELKKVNNLETDNIKCGTYLIVPYYE